MNPKRTLWIIIIALIAITVLFEVDFRFQFSLPRESRQRNPEQEARYEACFEERDRQIHETAFGTIDNPDVQKLYISNNRDEAAEDCREQFPAQWITVREPFRFNLIDLQFRF